MTANFGEIYLVKFYPSTGKEFSKMRPAMVIQMSDVSKKSPYITVVPISSKTETLSTEDVYLPMDKKNNLQKDSVIKVHQISSFDTKRFIKKIGETNSPINRKVRGYLRKHFGF
ncbi:type II toxin-antitoxin system PemK/MazF family toxin [Candidatus Peregrinibacteria bacterium]|nr:type II toxin-antitoxin system PemK/MazF family toxin [Candidatus Peregrinibacteria bacterium]